MATAAQTRWNLKGRGFEFIVRGACGDVDLSGVKCAAILVWPRSIHEGDGKATFVVDPATTDKQADALALIFTGKLGGMPWEILGPTYQVVGLAKAKITIEGQGRKITFRAKGVGEARGDTLKNPVTGEDHLPEVVLPHGFIWKRGEVGQGSFLASAGGLSVDFQRTNWIHYEFDWRNA